MDVVVSQLYTYPVKACQGIRHTEINLTATGLLLDRAWCVIDASGHRQAKNEAISLRRLPFLASIRVEMEGNTLSLRAPGMSCLQVPVLEKEYEGNENIVVECGGMSTTSAGGWHLGLQRARSAGVEAEQWLTQYLNSPEAGSKNKAPGRYVLVRSMSPDIRKCARYAGASQKPFSAEIKLQRVGDASPFNFQSLDVSASDAVRFQDMAPLHLASESSLLDLSKKMHIQAHKKGKKVHFNPNDPADESDYPITAFRPNIVITGNPAWSEELWLRIGVSSGSRNNTFRLWKNTPRCTVPNRDPETGKFRIDTDKFLATRTLGSCWPEKCVDAEWGDEWQGPSFGVHMAWDSASTGDSETGVIKVGDQLAVLKHRPFGPLQRIGLLLGSLPGGKNTALLLSTAAIATVVAWSWNQISN